jgi:hypothetical protein
MIENQHQYEVAKQKAARLKIGLSRLLEESSDRRIADPLLEEAALAGVRHILDMLHDEISDYESRTHGTVGGTNPNSAKGFSR